MVDVQTQLIRVILKAGVLLSFLLLSPTQVCILQLLQLITRNYYM